MGLEALLAKLEGRAVTSVTADAIADVTRTPAPTQACTPVTSVTAENDDTTGMHYRWLIDFADRNPVEVACSPPETHAEILAAYPDAIAAEPFRPTYQFPVAPLTAGSEAAIRQWLAQIGEQDAVIIARVLHQCGTDADARSYFVHRAEAEVCMPPTDDRRPCSQCADLVGMRCQAAARGEILANRNSEPILDLYRRREGYALGQSDTDPRPGRERWPGLGDTKVTA